MVTMNDEEKEIAHKTHQYHNGQMVAEVAVCVFFSRGKKIIQRGNSAIGCSDNDIIARKRWVRL
jgi:hypothetical protein